MWLVILYKLVQLDTFMTNLIVLISALCPKVYIGKTKQILYLRLNEQKQALASMLTNFAEAEHALKFNYEIE